MGEKISERKIQEKRIFVEVSGLGHPLEEDATGLIQMRYGENSACYCHLKTVLYFWSPRGQSASCQFPLYVKTNVTSIPSTSRQSCEDKMRNIVPGKCIWRGRHFQDTHGVTILYTNTPSSGASPETVLFLLVDFFPLGSHIISRLKGMLYIFPWEETRRIMSWDWAPWLGLGKLQWHKVQVLGDIAN